MVACWVAQDEHKDEIDRVIERNGCRQCGREGARPGGMEPAEHDLLAALRRARRSLRLQAMNEPPAVARLTTGQRIADAVATVMGSWSLHHRPERDPDRLDNRQPGGRHQGLGPLTRSFSSIWRRPATRRRSS